MANPRRPTVPLAPIIMVLALLGPMHLISVHPAVFKKVPTFLDRDDFQQRSSIKASQTTQKEEIKVISPPTRYLHSDLNLTKEDILNYERKSPKSSFDPLDHPLFNSTRKIKILYVTQKLGSGKVNHVFLDGFNRSDYLEVVDIMSIKSTDPITNLTYVDKGEDLWVDDSPDFQCVHIVALAQQQQQQQRTRPSIPILQLDYKDFSRTMQCPELEKVVDHVHYVKRSIVEGRQYNYTSAWVDHGYYINNTGFNTPVVHSPYSVRTDQVQVIADFLRPTNLTSPVDWEPKVYDIVHFWGVGHDPVSKLRNYITELVKKMSKETKLRCFANTAGQRGTNGRRNVQSQYVKIMLQSRIVIVTQRDKWEGHYRLMEALAGGVMVVADFMLSLPKGLVDRESVVLFRSEKELREVLLYYARHEEERRAIAQRGWEIVMSRHRSWHRMEEIVFGQPLTDVNNPHGPYLKGN